MHTPPPPYTGTYVEEGNLDDTTSTQPTSPTYPHHQHQHQHQHHDRQDFGMRSQMENLDPDCSTPVSTPDSSSPRGRPPKLPCWHWIKDLKQDDLHYPDDHSIYNEDKHTSDLKYLRKDLSQGKINDVHVHLWWVGRQGNIRPLHHQKAMFREIVVTERPHLHMVWFENIIFLKPLPEYLLDREWFEKKICPDSELFQLACGFLYSYSMLIVHKSDHKIAEEHGLLPEYMDWVRWCKFSKEIRETVHFGMINKRYRYGELRLKRLNHVYRFCRLRVRGFYSLDRGYNSFFKRNFGWMVGLFAFLTIILTAMQVILATDQGMAAGNGLFEEVSFVFGVVSIIIPVVGTGAALTLFFVLFWWHFVKTLHYRKEIQVERTKSQRDLEANRRR